jgi:uncharacterized protein YecT (DUF1311 family)
LITGTTDISTSAQLLVHFSVTDATNSLRRAMAASAGRYDDPMQRRYLTVVLAALVGLMAAGCSSGSSSSASSTAAGTTTSPSGQPSAAAASTAPPFAAIVEPFDPGHPAQPQTTPDNCGSELTTIGIEHCYQGKTESTDVQIDAVQQAAYNSATTASARAAIVAADSAWLAARTPVCQAAFTTGGTIDGISVATCLLAESTARLAAVKNVTPPEAVLKSTDSTDPNDLSWYTTPEGSRIAEIDTQGDQTGGAVIGWVIIGGADGFVINPKQFYFQDGSFTDPGIIEPPNPAYHRVATGVMYQFGIDYSRLSHDPNATKGTGGYLYAPGTPVAVWR